MKARVVPSEALAPALPPAEQENSFLKGKGRRGQAGLDQFLAWYITSTCALF